MFGTGKKNRGEGGGGGGGGGGYRGGGYQGRGGRGRQGGGYQGGEGRSYQQGGGRAGRGYQGGAAGGGERSYQQGGGGYQGGSQNLDRKEYSLLVIGETGAGKSTFINTLTNHFLGGTLQKLRVSIPSKFHLSTEGSGAHCERNIGDSSMSQTDSCTVYPFNSDENDCLFYVIDTPGLGDTRGTGQDDENIDKILKAGEAAENLLAIIIVVNGMYPRYTVGIASCMQRLAGNLPDTLIENILVVFSRCGSELKNQYEVERLPFPVKETNRFYMDNSAFSVDLVKAKREPNGRTLRMLDFEWTCSMEVANDLVNKALSFKTVATTALRTVRMKRDEVKAVLHDVKLKIGNIQDVQTQLETMEGLMKRYEGDVVKYKDYTQTKVVQEKSLVSAPYHSTICSSCNHVCHDHCGLDEISSRGSHQFTGCAAFSGENCHVCPSKCSYTQHYHGRLTMSTVEKTLEEVLQDMKDKFDQANQQLTSTGSQITDIASAKKLVEDTIDAEIQKLQASCREIMSLCSGFNLAAELELLLRQLETEKTLITNLTARDTAEKFIQTIRTIVDSLPPATRRGFKTDITSSFTTVFSGITSTAKSVVDLGLGLLSPSAATTQLSSPGSPDHSA